MGRLPPMVSIGSGTKAPRPVDWGVGEIAFVSISLIALFGMVLALAPGCKQAPPKDDLCLGCPYEDAPYLLRCKKCGKEWCSSSPPDEISDCPDCSLNICMESVPLILKIGTLQELARAQPDNAEAKQQLAECKAAILKHCETCDRCRDALLRD